MAAFWASDFGVNLAAGLCIFALEVLTLVLLLPLILKRRDNKKWAKTRNRIDQIIWKRTHELEPMLVRMMFEKDEKVRVTDYNNFRALISNRSWADTLSLYSSGMTPELAARIVRLVDDLERLDRLCPPSEEEFAAALQGKSTVRGQHLAFIDAVVAFYKTTGFDEIVAKDYAATAAHIRANQAA